MKKSEITVGENETLATVRADDADEAMVAYRRMAEDKYYADLGSPWARTPRPEWMTTADLLCDQAGEEGEI